MGVEFQDPKFRIDSISVVAVIKFFQSDRMNLYSHRSSEPYTQLC